MPVQIHYQDIGNGISCIDTQLSRPGLAACYLLEHDGIAGFIDTGTNNSIPILLEVLHQKGITPEAVSYSIPTHVHLDHAGGAGGLMQHCCNAKLIVHPRGARHMIDPTRLPLERVFLTHYGMHEDVGMLDTMLRLAVEDYVSIAMESVTSPQRQKSITDGLLKYSADYLLKQQCGLERKEISKERRSRKKGDLERKEIERLLIGDMRLNAQGLDHWLG